ncbi:hypothetical protein MnBA_05260 [Marinobacterium sp. BA1]
MMGADAVRCMRRSAGGASGGHTWWRINITSSDDDHDNYRASVGELEFRESVGGPSTTNGGIPYQSAGLNPERAFNGEPSLYWSAGPFDQLPIALGYHHVAPVEIVEVAIQAGTTSTQAARTPTGFTVDYSDDGISWATILTVTGEPPWAPYEIRTYTISEE